MVANTGKEFCKTSAALMSWIPLCQSTLHPHTVTSLAHMIPSKDTVLSTVIKHSEYFEVEM